MADVELSRISADTGQSFSIWEKVVPPGEVHQVVELVEHAAPPGTRTPTGDHDYVIHFDADAIPPVGASSSITMYDADGYTVPNDLDRYAIGDRDNLQFGPDGSLDIFIGRTSPGAELESNWLPAPEGPLGITMRLYSPRPEILDGRWNPPPVHRK